jgi:hypothetical protein
LALEHLRYLARFSRSFFFFFLATVLYCVRVSLLIVPDKELLSTENDIEQFQSEKQRALNLIEVQHMREQLPISPKAPLKG